MRTLFLSATSLLLVSCASVQAPAPDIQSFEDCVAAGNAIMESYPEQCRTEDGRTFTRDIGNANEKSDLIQVNEPMPGTPIVDPLVISGQARGYWFFEASFPIELQNDNGDVIAEGYATAEDEWMTEEFVPFTTSIEFAPLPPGTKGNVVLKRANASGLPENDDELVIPIVF